MDKVEWAQTKIEEIILNVTNTSFFYFFFSFLYCKGGHTLEQIVWSLTSPLLKIFKTQLYSRGERLESSHTRGAFRSLKFCSSMILYSEEMFSRYGTK